MTLFDFHLLLILLVLALGCGLLLWGVLARRPRLWKTGLLVLGGMLVWYFVHYFFD